jgi:4a-hydroxytetrahydrobiopterin dehydratase
MTTQVLEELASKRCKACEGGLERLSAVQTTELMEGLSGWKLIDDGRQIRKDWRAKNFLAGMEFLNQIAAVAEEEGHHPDVHLEEYRHVWIVLWTHAIGGLSENDFILAAKIDPIAGSNQLGEWAR